MSNQVTGLTRIYKAAGYSLKGLTAAWKNEAAFRQEAIVVVPAILLSFYLDVSSIERILMIGSLILVLVAELLNSAVEAAIDRIGPEFHTLSGRAKDMGSAAVLITIVFAIFTWATILVPRWL
ncbi:diacylglycerol kinase [Rouxiella silvae]|uniref:Diacylglycerol kinase n=1 Tax=Rouxiella silvae TaxID=1646373 RepID=A0AA40X6C3_9GAMM|nr:MULTISPECIES: diacylglycerol kinase [Rouxiella]KAB7898657.1 diacylglycerol kinase [Rouxiella sp. S1S-2]KQN49141.1 diacylglycerol kinase [Serratia sp. Leaf50]MBF6639487.1 diacylglycerol kinase [Rouxiella silvae]ORJ20737.1 diacylglycerol kinase [Rouxiella silvae]